MSGGIPELIKASRRRRIALGSGTSTAEVNRLLKQFAEMQKMMKMISGGKTPASVAASARCSVAERRMHRLVIASVTLVGLVGVAVVAGYLTLFAGPADRAAPAPAGTTSTRTSTSSRRPAR